MKLTQVLKILIFCGLFLLISIPMTMVFTPKWISGNTPMTTTTLGFQNEEENSIDVLYIGSSQILRGVSPLTIWHEQGIAGYTRAMTVMPSAVALYYLEEAQKTQDIQLVVIDFSALYAAYDVDEREPYVRYAFDYMPLNANKLRTVDSVLAESKEQTIASYAYPLLRYHMRWSELTKSDFQWLFAHEITDANKGAVMLNDVEVIDFDPERMTAGDERAKYNETAYRDYADFVAYCKEQGIRVLSVRMPRADWTTALHNADADFAKANGIDFIDTNDPAVFAEIGLDPAADFLDYDHLNTDGALKFSAWLGKYLKANYELEDTRNAAAYRSWQRDYELFTESMEK